MLLYQKVDKGIEWLSDVLNLISKFMLGCIVGFMCFAILLQVTLRYVFNTGLSWPEELTVFLLAWMTFLGSAVAVKQSEHINIDLLVNRLSGRTQWIIHLINKLAVLIFVSYFVYYGLKMAFMSLDYKSNALGISLFWPRISMGIGGSLMILHTVHFIMKDFRRVIKT
jgi:TRAP-type C4-dicarboxylate transport system permease small subunit